MVKIKWFILKLFGLERVVWDSEWAAGRWDYLDEANPVSVDIVRKYAREGKIVELGCGSGALVSKVGSQFFSGYEGIDISPIAIARATSRCLEKCQFRTGAMESAVFGAANLIIIQEALFYLTASEQMVLLRKCLDLITTDGAVYITVHDPPQFSALLSRARRIGRVLEDRCAKNGPNEFAHLVIGRSGTDAKN